MQAIAMRNMNLNTLTFTIIGFKTHDKHASANGPKDKNEKERRKRKKNIEHLSFNLLFL